MSRIQPPASPSVAPWYLAILDRGDDARIMLATIALSADVQAVQLTEGRYDWPSVLEFITTRLGQPVEATPLTNPAAWDIRAKRGDRP